MPSLLNGTLAWGESVVNGGIFEVVENLARQIAVGHEQTADSRMTDCEEQEIFSNAQYRRPNTRF